MPKTVVCLMGPTATGKTNLAIELYQRLNAELISVDSVMIYREMDIGSAKPDPMTLARAPHQLIDIVNPNQAYSVAEFRHAALTCIAKAHAQNKLPILVGGTMMYFKALLQGLAVLPKACPVMRKKLEQRLKDEGLARLYKELQSIDIRAARRINANDPQRILRALEVYQLSGLPLSEHWRQQKAQAVPYQYLCIGLLPEDRKKLHALIERRFLTMLELGFLDEAERLIAKWSLDLSMPALRSVGYRQAYAYLLGNLSFEAMQQKAIVATRQLAKRQMTWLRSWPSLYTLEPYQQSLTNEALELIERHCNR